MNEKTAILDIISLKEHYQDILRELKSNSSKYKNLEEVQRNIFTSNKVKVFLIGDTNNKQILIQIEVLPTEQFTLKDSNYYSREIKQEIKDIPKSILEYQISSLGYLRVLSEKGFTLSLVEEECIWYATKALETEPTEELCVLLNPLLKWAFHIF